MSGSCKGVIFCNLNRVIKNAYPNLLPKVRVLIIMDLPTILTFFSALSFLFFGLGCLTSSRLKNEFIRYGYPHRRVLTGYLQLLGAIGLLLGYWLTAYIALSAATGLCLLMILGFGVRLKIKDSFWVSLPAFLYASVSLYLCIHYFQYLA